MSCGGCPCGECPLVETCCLCPGPMCCPPPFKCPRPPCKYIDSCPPCPYIPCCVGPVCKPINCAEDPYFFIDPCLPLVVHNSVHILKPTSLRDKVKDKANPNVTYFMANQDRIVNTENYDVCFTTKRCCP